jgi:hypothetical protein
VTPRVLVVTAEAGEPQLDPSARALARQEGVTWERVVISGLPIEDAQRAVHAAAAAAAQYDWVLKLDGDMVLSHPRALLEMIDRAEAARTEARYTEPVLDWYTDRQIEGVHLLRPRAVPPEVEIAPPFFDRWIAQMPGVVVRRLAVPAVLHGPEANLEQGLRFGLQRGSKARSQGPRGGHWHRIDDLRRNWRTHGHPVVQAAVAGAAVGLGLAPEVPPSPDLVSRTSPRFAALLRSLTEDPSRAPELARPLTRPFGTWRSHLQVNGSLAEASRAFAANVKRRSTAPHG